MNAQLNRSFPGTMLVLAGVAALGASTSASADHNMVHTINIFADMENSTEGLGDFWGSLTYDFVLGDEGVLTVELTNTADVGNRGWITGFIFNIGGDDPNATAHFEKGTHPFLDAHDQNGQPFGNPFVAGAALAGNWIDGGSPEDGIAPFETGIFEFEVIAKDAETLTASSFLPDSPYEFNFIVRFRGFLDDNSDKVPAIPGPGALALLGLGALAQRRRRRSA